MNCFTTCDAGKKTLFVLRSVLLAKISFCNNKITNRERLNEKESIKIANKHKVKR